MEYKVNMDPFSIVSLTTIDYSPTSNTTTPTATIATTSTIDY